MDLAIALGCLLLASPAHAALLEGKPLSVYYVFRPTETSANETIGPALITVGPGVELTGFGFNSGEGPPSPPLVDIDVSDRQIMISLITDQPAAYLQVFQFIDYTHTIPGVFTNKVRTNAATTWASFTDGRAQGAGDGIVVAIGGLPGRQGQFILLDVVPEPASIALLAGTVPLAMLHRRRR